MTSFSFKPGNKKPNPANMVKASIFRQADDDDEVEKPTLRSFKAGAGNQGLLLNLNQASRDKIAEQASKHLLEDPDVFEYDKFVDSYRTKREEIVEKKKERGKARYIGQILSAADKRKREQTILQERVAEKQIERENAQYGDKERFVTSSYLKMMEENKQFEEEDRLKEAYNQEHSATNQDNIGGLHRTLYASDIYAGGHRPDLNKELQKPAEKPVAQAPKQQPTAAAPQQREAPLKEAQTSIPEQSKGEAPKDIAPEPEKSRVVTRERSRSKSKDREKKQETPEVQLPKQETKEERLDKVKLAKERYLQRKFQTQDPKPEDAPQK